MRTPDQHRATLGRLAAGARDTETVRPAAEWALDVEAKARAVREAQGAYFARRRPADLERSKRLEAELDVLLGLRPPPRQLGLFGGGR